ncbi:uncharacterized protein [Argopecten irradians]|uniref:uncharacterized protein n=1 Tax=Argopecten irradians TaxID=31199 RepID=UPI003714BAB4
MFITILSDVCKLDGEGQMNGTHVCRIHVKRDVGVVRPQSSDRCMTREPLAGEFRTHPTWNKSMPVNGQGVFTFNITRNAPFLVVMTTATTSDNVKLTIGETFAELGITHGNEYTRLSRIEKQHVGYEEDRQISYWVSCNRDSLVLKYGKGYTMEETTLLECDLLTRATTREEQKEIRDRYHVLFSAEGKGIVELYDSKAFISSSALKRAKAIDSERSVCFRKNPFIRNLSPFVLHSDHTTLSVLDSGLYMLSGSLPPGCKEMYDNIRKIELDSPPEVDGVLLSDAIRFSIDTNGCLLHNMLQEKARYSCHQHNARETYLRVTLGENLGDSPGIPYVLEIWPSKHYSPIHNHGNANAVIKVLFGQINVSIYNKHTTDPDEKPLKTFVANSGDVTWISQDWYQTHKLWNNTADYCATIQCYKYDPGDTTHWSYFDYVGENSTIEGFLPSSDITFRDMRQKVLDEYRQTLCGSTQVHQDLSTVQ